MLNRRVAFIILVFVFILGGCSSIGAPANQADTLNGETEQALPNPTPTRSPATPSVTAVSQVSGFDWEDRSVFLPSLNESGQPALESLPMASVYHLSLQIPAEMSEAFFGELEVRYFNQEDLPLNEIYFRLFPNFYGGQLTVENVAVDGMPVSTFLESAETALRVALNQPLTPAASVVVSLDFSLRLPQSMGGNYGLLGFFEDILVLDTFYPMIPAYDQDGWYSHLPYPNGDLTYNDASFYLVEVSAPERLVLASSGSVIQEKVQGGRQHLMIASGPARDFFLAGSERFSVASKEVEGVLVNSYTLEVLEPSQGPALEYAVQAIQAFSDLFGAYPYREFDVISSPMLAMGIEYPGIVGILWQLYEEDEGTAEIPNQVLLESVVAHEVGHQWFYNVVGNDQQSDPWVDESLTQYVTQQYFIYTYGESAGSGLKTNWGARWGRVYFDETPLGLAADEYDNIAYGAILYGRGPIFYLELENALGRELLLEGLRSYYNLHQWQLAGTEEVRASIESACGCDLGELFTNWVYPVE